MKVKLAAVFFAAFIFIIFPSQVQAVCPVCIVAVGAGVGFSRWIGISDLITGLWLGGFITALSVWTVNFLQKKHIKFPFRKIIVFFIYFLLTFLPLHFSKITGHPFNQILGIDKLLFGSAIGTALFISSIFLDKYIRKNNNGKVRIYYQKVILPVTLLLLFSLVFFLAKI